MSATPSSSSSSDVSNPDLPNPSSPARSRASSHGSSSGHSTNITERLAQVALNDSGRGTLPSASGSTSSAARPLGQQSRNVHPSEALQFCRRPEGGVNPKVCSSIRLFTNHFPVRTPDNIGFVLYNVEVIKGEKREILRKREEISPIFWKIAEANPDVFLTDVFFVDGWAVPLNYVFNDVNLLYVRGANTLPGIQEKRVFDHTGFSRGKRVLYKMVISITGAQNAGFRHNSPIQDIQHARALLDLLLSARVRCPLHPDSQRYATFKNNIYKVQLAHENRRESDKFCISLGHGVRAWAGLHAALKLNLMCKAPLVNVDLTYKFYYHAGNTLLDQCFEILERRRTPGFNINAFDAKLNSRGRKDLLEALRGVELIAYHTSAPRRYKVYGISEKTARTHTFRLDDGQFASVEEYFLMRHNIRLRYPNLPLVKVHKVKETFMPFEVLQLTDDPQKYKGQPREELLSAFVRRSALGPAERADMIMQMVGADDEQRQAGGLVPRDEIMDRWGVELDTQMREVPGKMLRQPQLQFGLPGGKLAEPVQINSDGTWEVSDRQNVRQAISTPRATAWMIVAVDRKQMGIVSLEPFAHLMKTLQAFGMDIVSNHVPVRTFEWEYKEPVGDPRDVLKQEMELFVAEVVAKTREAKESPNPEIPEDLVVHPCVLFIYPSKNPAAYSLSKYMAEVRCGVYHQGILKKTYDNLCGSVAGCTTAHNMFFKINAKLGGTHHRIPSDGAFKPWCKVVNDQEPTLFIGIDVTHPPSEDQRRTQERRRAAQGGNQRRGATEQDGDDESMNRGNSVAAVVGNIDIDATQYRMSCRIERVEQERLINICELLTERIDDFITNNNNKKPKHIVIYRDGVSETEFKRTFYEEQKSYQNALARLNMEGPDRPTLTYIVTTKRHHTRFFPGHDADNVLRSGNFRPGLLVEDDVVSSEYFDFYILSQQAALGTARPTHYYVLHDEWNPSPGHWQCVTFALCHLYCRTNRSVSLPAPVYYAHLAAKRAADWISGYERNYLVEDCRRMWSVDQIRADERVQDKLKEQNTKSKLEGMLFC